MDSLLGKTVALKKKFTQLVREVLPLSTSDDWNIARKEWEIIWKEVWSVDDGITCVCGYVGLVYVYKLRNVLNGNILYPIGSVCIEHFKNDTMDQVVKDVTKIHRREKDIVPGGRFKDKRYIDVPAWYFEFLKGKVRTRPFRRMVSYYELRMKRAMTIPPDWWTCPLCRGSRRVPGEDFPCCCQNEDADVDL
jgi:hypothetical protein